MRRMYLVGALILIAAATLVAQTEQEPVLIDKDGLAVKGYDVVAYFELGEARRGSADHEVTYGGAIYRFINAAHRAMFVDDPEAFIPQYGGYCSWAASEGYTASIQPAQFTIEDGRLFLNYNRGTRRRFEADLEDRIERADANWPAIRESLR